MGDEVLFNRYAIALLEIAIEQNKTEEFRKEVKILKNIFQNSPEFCEILCDVNIDLAKKYSMIDKILASVNSDILSFVKVIIKNNRAHYLYKIFKESLYRFDDYLEIQEGKLILSKEMSEEEKEKIIKSIEKNEGVRLELEEVIDPSILGGFIVTLKDNVYDASLKTKLQNLKESLKN
ncbi:MAG: ATP synthase F1 subunit delta [bacterium]|nr:ATP synthase F1 subunit delta [bacterium]MDY4159183.1 ATP synthase F1 subunit delta [Candidatus Onthovivens sp.]